METFWFVAGSFILNVLCTVIGTTWFISNRLRDHEANFREALNDHQLSDNAQFAEVRKEIIESGDGLRREVGETFTAVRTKMFEMETWNRDTFLRRQSFFEVTKEMGSDIKSLIEKVTRIETTQNANRK